jgi:hypothetical protein
MILPNLTHDDWNNMSSKLKIAIKILSPLLLLVPLASCSAVAELSGVTLDVSRVETMIEDGVLEQGGFYVVATCPDPMVGEVGETRTCTIEDEYGDTELVDVTIQNSEGDVVWEVRG